MAETQTRRSCRVAMAMPIRVFGTDFRGIDFTEEALTTIVNLHGAKIRLSHQLLPEAGNPAFQPFDGQGCGVPCGLKT